MAEGARLESVFTLTRNVGSNPTLSAREPDRYQTAPEACGTPTNTTLNNNKMVAKLDNPGVV